MYPTFGDCFRKKAAADADARAHADGWAPRDAVAPELSGADSEFRFDSTLEQRDGAPCESTTGVTNIEALLRQLEEEARNVERAEEALAAAELARVRLREAKEAELSGIRAETRALEAEIEACARMDEMLRIAQQYEGPGHDL